MEGDIIVECRHVTWQSLPEKPFRFNLVDQEAVIIEYNEVLG